MSECGSQSLWLKNGVLHVPKILSLVEIKV